MTATTQTPDLELGKHLGLDSRGYRDPAPAHTPFAMLASLKGSLAKAPEEEAVVEEANAVSVVLPVAPVVRVVPEKEPHHRGSTRPHRERKPVTSDEAVRTETPAPASSQKGTRVNVRAKKPASPTREKLPEEKFVKPESNVNFVMLFRRPIIDCIEHLRSLRLDKQMVPTYAFYESKGVERSTISLRVVGTMDESFGAVFPEERLLLTVWSGTKWLIEQFPQGSEFFADELNLVMVGGAVSRIPAHRRDRTLRFAKVLIHVEREMRLAHERHLAHKKQD